MSFCIFNTNFVLIPLEHQKGPYEKIVINLSFMWSGTNAKMGFACLPKNHVYYAIDAHTLTQHK